MLTPVAPSTSNINDRLQCRRHLKAEEVMRPIGDIYDSPRVDFRNKADRAGQMRRHALTSCKSLHTIRIHNCRRHDFLDDPHENPKLFSLRFLYRSCRRQDPLVVALDCIQALYIRLNRTAIRLVLATAHALAIVSSGWDGLKSS
jgi:hypothetical protein